jgi:3-methylcrotonyl-CoA carboxylase alpha subunit
VAAGGSVRIGGVNVDEAGRDVVLVPWADGVEARRQGRWWRFLAENPGWGGKASAGPSDGQIVAPMPGKLLALPVKAGDQVKAGDRLAVLEAMKMEHRLTAPFDATVETVSVVEGAQVAEGMLLVTLVKA